MCRFCLLLVAISFFCSPGAGQHRPAPVSEVFGKYEFIDNLITIRPADSGRLEISFTGICPNSRRRQGGVSPNTGSFSEVVPFQDGVATVRLSFSGGDCIIRIKPVGNSLLVTQKGDSSACGFGFNVSAAGRYTRIRRRK